ncbi:synaptic vesicle glycoprotein 2C [Dendroctonus ponderosae]|uniref:synaptic vesicle glycoprotein 2C n=1 Tax=Dendroctonus ponderosae TaxID=77166 RepID=UPI0020350267|nr:synaptic vesicle glycoprotein 2C [Dendroctonus ponderosae]
MTVGDAETGEFNGKEFPQENGDKTESEEPADFEKAIVAAKWGKFHLLVYAISITSGWSSIFETTTMSYVFPAAECDLDLKLEHKGLLNAITYTGMISTGFVWGYLCDTLGRKKLLVTGYLLDAIFVFLASSSQSFAMLMVAKFFGGFIINGPFSAITTYLSELHCTKQRGKAQFLLGIIYSAGTLVLPVLAIYILPLNIRINLGDIFVIHSWNIYLFICAFVPLTSAIAFLFLPESPKFLMTTGKNEKALKVFKKIYSMNTGQPEETFPIKSLQNEIELNSGNKYGKVTANRSKSKAFLEGWQQLKPLFHRPYRSKIILVCIIQCLTMNSLNTLRLWLPQIFQAMNDYELAHNSSAALCDAVAAFKPNETLELEPTECVVNTNNNSVYINSIIVCVATILAYVIATGLINKVGKKRLFVLMSVTSGVSAMALYFSRSTVVTLILASIFIGAGSVTINNMLAVIVEMFPTTLRTMTVALAMMSGRAGAVLGNTLYPLLLKAGCGPVFFYNGLLSLSCGLLVLLLPVDESASLT